VASLSTRVAVKTSGPVSGPSRIEKRARPSEPVRPLGASTWTEGGPSRATLHPPRGLPVPSTARKASVMGEEQRGADSGSMASSARQKGRVAQAWSRQSAEPLPSSSPGVPQSSRDRQPEVSTVQELVQRSRPLPLKPKDWQLAPPRSAPSQASRVSLKPSPQ